MPPFGPNRTPPTDETFQPGEAMTQVKSEADLAPGVVIRVWHEQLNRWIPGWWLEVLEVKGGRVYLRDLQSQERNDRSLRDTLGVAWIHPQPARVSSLGTARAAAEASRLAELRAGYARMDLEQATQTEMTATLHQELQWPQSHMDRRYDMK